MSILARRSRDQVFERERALVDLRDGVVAATTAYLPSAGSAATLEAVDEALAQLVAAGAHLAEAEQVKGLWIKTARCRLIDDHRSAESQRRDAIAVDNHTTALQVSACGDPGELFDQQRQSWRVQEILSVLHGEQRKWAQAWHQEVLSGLLPAGAQPRGLPEVLGWTSAKTEKTAQRARRKMAEFVTQRQAGQVCEERRGLLDTFIVASTHGGALTRDLDHERYAAVVFHVAGCDDCFAAWHTRRRTTFARPLAILMLPLDALVGAAQAFAAKVAGITAAAATSILGRLGMGGAAAAGGGVATLGTKATAVCIGVVCAATAGGEIAGVLPPIVSAPAPATRIQDAPEHANTPAQPAAITSGPVAAPPAPTPPAAPAPSADPGSSSTPRPPPAVAPAVVTPGDLPAAAATSPPPAAAPSAARSATPPPPPPAARPLAGAGGGSSSCVPGTLGC